MKMRELKRKAGGSVWPPICTGASGRGGTFAMGEQGTLTAVKRVGKRLNLTIDHEGRARFGSLEWDPPPTLDQVEKLLHANVGQTIKEISKLEV